MRSSARRTWILLGVWLALFGIALALDRGVAQWVDRVHPLDRQSWPIRVLKWYGGYPFALLLCVMLGVVRRSIRAAMPLVISGPLVGIVYIVLKWVVGRRRPVMEIAPFQFHAFAHGWRGLIVAERGLSFPSGHATMAFATATCLAAAIPRGAAAWYLLAAAVGAERILEDAHYVSDVVAGAGLGILCALAALRMTRAQPPRGLETGLFHEPAVAPGDVAAPIDGPRA